MDIAAALAELSRLALMPADAEPFELSDDARELLETIRTPSRPDRSNESPV